MSISQALFTPAQSKVLAWLFGQPERWFHMQELLRLTSLASASLQREISRLHKSGLVQEERVGNLRRVRANPGSPVFAELLSLIRKTVGIAPQLAQALQPVAVQLQLALVFGSVAKETDHADSDIDVLLVSDTLTLNEAFTALLPAEQNLSRSIQPLLYTGAEFAFRRAQAGSVVQRILAAPYVLLHGLLE